VTGDLDVLDDRHAGEISGLRSSGDVSRGCPVIEVAEPEGGSVG
jgi:hypothetical protein